MVNGKVTHVGKKKRVRKYVSSGRRSLYLATILAFTAVSWVLHKTLKALDASRRIIRPIFLVGVFTTLQHVRERQRIRDGIFSPDDQRICSLQNFLMALTPQSCTVLYTFVIGGNPVGPTALTTRASSFLAKVEASEHDVTFLDIQENMEDGKTLTWFVYASSLLSQHKIDYVSKMDCDTYLNFDLFFNFIHRDLKPAHGLRLKVYGGILNEALSCGVLVGNKVCRLLLSRVYMSGQFYFVSADLVEYVALYGSEHLDERVNIEDIDFSIWVQSHPEAVHLVSMAGEMMWFHSQETKTEEGWTRAHKSMLTLPVRHKNLKMLDECLYHGYRTCRNQIFRGATTS